MKSLCHCFLEAVRPCHAAVSCHLPVPVPETQSHRAVTGAFSFFASPSRQFSSESLHWHSVAEFPLCNLGLSVTHSTPPHTFPRKAAGCSRGFHTWARRAESLAFPKTPYLKQQQHVIYKVQTTPSLSTCFVQDLSYRKARDASGLQRRAGDRCHGHP